MSLAGEVGSEPSVASNLELPDIRAVRLEIRTRWQRPNVIPGPVLANVLRGALGLTLRTLVCPEEWRQNACAPCELYSHCAYGQVFMPTPGGEATQLRLQQDLPRPFVIEPPGLDPEDRVTPEGITFRLMLFGSAIEQLPFLISTLDRLGHDGLGRDRVPFQVERITACHPEGDETLFTSGSHDLALPKKVITTRDLLALPWPEEVFRSAGQMEIRQRVLARMGRAPTAAPALAVPADQPLLKLRFITPLLLKSGSGIDANGVRVPAQEVREKPPMGVLIRRLRDRLGALCLFFGERWDCPDFTRWGTLADEVRIVESRTTWLTRNRRSSRTGQSHEISGLVGQTTYAFPNQETFATLRPLLRLGELIHVGKNAPWGNGGIQGVIMRGEMP